MRSQSDTYPYTEESGGSMLRDQSRVIGFSPHSTIAAGGAAPPLAPPNTCRLYHELDTNQLLASINGSAWFALAGATGGSGWTDDGAIVRLTNITDSVGIGTNNPGGAKLFVASQVDQITLQVSPISIGGQTADVVRVSNNDGTVLHMRIYPNDGVDLGSAHRLSGDISPAALAGNVNDYNPTSLSVASVIRQATGGGVNRNITGLAGGADGRVVVLMNLSDVAAETITLTHEDAASAAANRFHLPDLANRVIARSSSVTLWYDSTISRWRVMG